MERKDSWPACRNRSQDDFSTSGTAAVQEPPALRSQFSQSGSCPCLRRQQRPLPEAPFHVCSSSTSNSFNDSEGTFLHSIKPQHPSFRKRQTKETPSCKCTSGSYSHGAAESSPLSILPSAPASLYSSSVSVQRTVTMLSVFGRSRRGKQNDTMLAAAALTSSHSPVN